MRVLHLSHTDIRYDSRIAKELLALETLGGYEIMAIGLELDEGASASESALKGQIVTIRLFSKVLRRLPRAVRYALSMFELTLRFVFIGIRSRPALVHCHDTLVLLAGVIIKFTTGCKLVYDAHELESNKNGQSRALSKGTLLIEKLCWRWVDLLVSVSGSILDWYRDHLGPKANILVLNSPEIARQPVTGYAADATGRYFHELYNIPKDKLVFVYLGILGAGRGIELALESFSSSRLDAHLVFVGYGDLSSRIQSFCDAHQNIHLHKPVPHDQVVGLVASADIGLCLVENVSLSDYYCLPNKLFEYVFAGLKVLASDFPEIRKVVQDHSLGACCKLESETVCMAMKALLEHPPGRVSTDLTELSWGVQARRLVGAYRELLPS